MPKKIFIVDDSITVLQSIRLELEKHGYEVIEALNGSEAKDKLDE